MFVAVVDAGSFAAAARMLSRSPPTVTRVVADLERRLGVTLLDRNSRRCRPTETGARLVDDARGLLTAYEDAASTASGEATEARGRVRITAPLVFGREHVAPAVGEFLDRHPRIAVELDLSDRQLDLHQERIDLAVRIGPVTDQSLTARRVGAVRRVIVASPEYLRGRGHPAGPQDLREHDIIQHGSRSDAPLRFQDKRGRVIEERVAARLTVNQADAAIAAAAAGRGLVSALSYQVHDAVSAGSLVRVLAEWEADPVPVNLAWPEGRQQLRRVRLVIDHLVATLSRLDVIEP